MVQHYCYCPETLERMIATTPFKNYCTACGGMYPRPETEEKKMATVPQFVTKDSGERHQFASGMMRDTSSDKARYDLVYLPMLKRWAELMARGAKKYGERNWEKAAGSAEYSRFKESAFRHFMQWFTGENPDEDHAAAVFFNISGAEYVKQQSKDEDHATRVIGG